MKKIIVPMIVGAQLMTFSAGAAKSPVQKVDAGDTLLKIAACYKIDFDKIASFDSWFSKLGCIFPGQDSDKPNVDVVPPDEDVIPPEHEGIKPDEDGSKPEQDELVPDEDVSKPGGDGVVPDENLPLPDDDTIPEQDTGIHRFESEVVRLVNEIRAQNGLSALTHDSELSKVARIKSQDMKDKNYFSHNSPNYGSPFDMMKTFGISYRSAAENIAKGQTSPEAVVNAWMNSAGHRKNILGASYTHIGVGYVANGNYWTQMFVGR